MTTITLTNDQAMATARVVDAEMDHISKTCADEIKGTSGEMCATFGFSLDEIFALDEIFDRHFAAWSPLCATLDMINASETANMRSRFAIDCALAAQMIPNGAGRKFDEDAAAVARADAFLSAIA